jgi:diaminopimelate epimerase
MSTIPFCKFHGFGNDYIVIEKQLIGDASLPDLAKAICHRHTGAGADGIAVEEKIGKADADFFCEIVNPDGSIAGFSGNGTRCAVAYLYYKEIWTAPSLKLRTKSGIKNYSLVENESSGHYVFEAEIGKPKFASNEIPVKTDAPTKDVIDLKITDRNVKVTCVNVGNPVACIFVDNFNFEWRTLGRQLETHPIFPERANIVFVKVIDRENIELRIWERGAGETSASGTCASGAAVLSAHTGRTDRRVSIKTVGGVTMVNWRSDEEIVLTGNADIAYCGEWLVR